MSQRNKGQKPVHLRPSGAINNRDKVWAAIRALKIFTIINLQDESEVSMRGVVDYVKGYIASGHVERLSKASSRDRATYRLVKDVGIEAPRVNRDGSQINQGKGQEVMWRSMRMLGDFSVQDLLVQARESGVKLSEETAKDYCITLAKAGYLKTYKNPIKRYLLIKAMYTGPRPPMIQRCKQVYDPNLDKVIWRQKQGGEDE